jgi:hypothetical protein
MHGGGNTSLKGKLTTLVGEEVEAHERGVSPRFVLAVLAGLTECYLEPIPKHLLRSR